MRPILFILLTAASVTSCSPKTGTFYSAALGLQHDRLIISSQLATVLTVSSYDMQGQYLDTLADYQTEANGPRGLAPYDATFVALSLDGDDRLDLVAVGGGHSGLVQSSFLTGVIGKLTRDPVTQDYFVIEGTNAIERFSSDGQRVPLAGNPFQTGARAPCISPASLRALVFNNAGNLVAVQSGTTTAFIYTPGPTIATACAQVTGLPSNVNDIINHSDGNLYWVGTNSQVYRASQTLTGSTSIFNNTSAILTPTALVEMPNGDLLIASDGTDSLQVIGTDGSYRGTFHKSIHTQQVNSLLILRGQ